MDVEVILDLDNITKSLSDWDKVSQATMRGYELGKIEVGERTHKKLLENLSLYGLGGSEIANTIRVTHLNDGIQIKVLSDYAIYVEYGTGLKGKGSPHPKPDGWEYNIGETIRANGGWWYPTTMEDPNPNKKVYNGQLYAWTIAGQPSRPFMYKTWRWASASVTQIIRKNIRRELRKVR